MPITRLEYIFMSASRHSSHASPHHKNQKQPKPPRRWAWLWLLLVVPLLAALAGLGALVVYSIPLDQQIRAEFEGRRWALPARVFARPLELYAGLPLTQAALERELGLLHYRQGDTQATGEFRRQDGGLIIHTRGFPFADGHEPARRVRVHFDGGRISRLGDVSSGESLGIMRLEPSLIANIYPAHGEDRVLVRLDEVPQSLIDALLATEDRKFYEHVGIDFIAVFRAAVANLQAGRTVQGGSTVTQQLVKNYFLTRERSLRRKFNEAIMALLLERHYSKADILEAYLNEVYLGQDGSRAIHGFGLAAQFYFQRHLSELSVEHMALLVAVIRGPSYYDPRRHPQRALERRNRVLDMMVAQGVLDSTNASQARARPLGVTEKAPSGVTPFPAFVQLVREQLRRDYAEEVLQSEGLLIFTTLDPLVQLHAEEALTNRLTELEKARRMEEGTLQGAVVVTTTDSGGEVLALVGDRQVRYAGFNRALNAQRPIGSLIKPVVFLAALERPHEYTLASLLDDNPLEVRMPHGATWTPRNYDRQFHGQVTLMEALVRSYNVSTARLGLSLGLERVVTQFERMVPGKWPAPYPSLLLGAVELTPFEVAQMYQGIAAGGYSAPLRAIREVLSADGVLLQRYPLSLRTVADPAAVYLLTAALHEVTRRGTAASLQNVLPRDKAVAGKTGTTDELRDTWFAGYSGEHLAVVWVGRDDNQSTGLTGASGALRVWGDLMKPLLRRGLEQPPPQGIEWYLIDQHSGLLANDDCEQTTWMPFIQDFVPTDWAPCARPASPHPDTNDTPVIF